MSLSTFSSSSAGSSTASPYTATDAADTMTEVSANAVQLNGRPHALPFTTAARDWGEPREVGEVEHQRGEHADGEADGGDRLVDLFT